MLFYQFGAFIFCKMITCRLLIIILSLFQKLYDFLTPKGL
jgi:hypothetical protein